MERAKAVLVAIVVACGLAVSGCREYREYEKAHDDMSPGGFYQSKAFRDLDKLNRSTEPHGVYRNVEALEITSTPDSANR